MSILLKRYSGFPPELFERGIAPRIRDCTFRLYILLCRESDRLTNRRLSFTDRYARDKAGISQTSMRTARRELESEGLAVCSRNIGGQFTYELCDIDTSKPYPGDPTFRPPSIRKDANAFTQRSGDARIQARSQPSQRVYEQPKVSAEGKTVYFLNIEEEDDDTAFPFGANGDDPF